MWKKNFQLNKINIMWVSNTYTFLWFFASSKNKTEQTRNKAEYSDIRQSTKKNGPRVKRDLPFIYQRDRVKSCTNAASTSIISGGKAVDFAAFAAGVLTLVLNVNNNINNNNNNNNNLNINAIDSSNVVANFNTNNANQVQYHLLEYWLTRLPR